MQRNILEYLEHTACRVPEKIALSGEDGELTFREVYEQARSIGTRRFVYVQTRKNSAAR